MKFQRNLRKFAEFLQNSDAKLLKNLSEKMYALNPYGGYTNCRAAAAARPAMLARGPQPAAQPGCPTGRPERQRHGAEQDAPCSVHRGEPSEPKMREEGDFP